LLQLFYLFTKKKGKEKEKKRKGEEKDKVNKLYPVHI